MTLVAAAGRLTVILCCAALTAGCGSSLSTQKGSAGGSSSGGSTGGATGGSQGAPPSINITGIYSGNYVPEGGGRQLTIKLILNQSGETLSGQTVDDGSTHQDQGHIDSDGNFILVQDGGPNRGGADLVGSATSDGSQLKGSWTSSTNHGTWFAHRSNG